MSTGPKGELPKQRKGTDRRGGARENSGRKYSRVVLPKDELDKLFAALDAQGKIKGETWQENFSKHLFSSEWQEAARFHQMLVGYTNKPQPVKPQQVETEKKDDPVGLPAMNIDPGKVTPIKKQA